jgi:N-acetylglucosaminyldiphosphoundecaprenol N-acetyl-beta-D-mannosaminyltransferase
MPTPVRILGTTLNLVGRTEVLTACDTAAASCPVHIATANPEFLLDARHNIAFRRALQATPFVTIDGSGLYFLAKLARSLGKIPRSTSIEHIPGATLIDELFQRYANGEKTLYFTGSTPEVLEQAITTIRKQHPGIQIIGSHWGGKMSATQAHLDPELIADIAAKKPDIILVGMGAARQELWMEAIRSHPACPPIALGIGGALRFYGERTRAPKIMQKLHLEWLYRTFTEKGHLRRSLRATLGFGLLGLDWLLFGSAQP